MKTLNLNVMKKAVVGIVISFLISFSARATESKVTYNNDKMTEEAVVRENWMSEPTSWISLESSVIEVDAEDEINLEGWMINTENETWVSDQEEEMEIEAWMVSLADYSKNAEELEEDLTLEEWMLNPSTWMK